MKNSKKYQQRTVLLAFTAGMLFANMGLANDVTQTPQTINTNFYIGIGIGASSIKPIVEGSYQVTDSHDLAKQIILGIKLNSSFALESSYGDLGKAKVANTRANTNSEISYKQTTLGILYYPNINKSLGKVFFELGARRASNNVADTIEDKTKTYFGIGTDITFSKEQQVDLRFSYKGYSEDSKAAFINVIKRF